MGKGILKDKSYKFSIHIVKMCQQLITEKEFVLSKQLLRSGTAKGTLIREAEFAESKKDFTHKMSIALKEANEYLYWLDLMKDTELIEIKVYSPIHSFSVISCDVSKHY